jgi:hypothetical protein
MPNQVSATTAHRIERAVRETFAEQLAHGTYPQAIPNYITAPGRACWAVVWHEGPEDWPGEFINELPTHLVPDDVFLEAHDHGVLAVFPFSQYASE